jgi:apolipoprotein N-acyltransferase
LSTRDTLKRLVLAGAAGTLMFMSCERWNIWPFAWFAMVPLLWLLDRVETGRRAFAWGFVTGMFANGGGFYWLTPFLERFAHLPAIGAVPLFLLLISYQALLYGAFGLLVWRLRKSSGVGGDQRLPMVLVGPLVMVALELVVPFIFPWYYAITQAWVRPVIQIAELTGPLGVTGLLLVSNGAIYDLLNAWRGKTRPPVRAIAIGGGVIAAVLVFGMVRIHQVEAARAADPQLKIGLVQPNFGIAEERKNLGVMEQLIDLRRMSADLEARGAQLVVWPEGSFPVTMPRPLEGDLEAPWSIHMRGFDVPVVVGALTEADGSNSPYNSAFLLGADDRVDGFYDKNILMMFGEYIPFYDQMKWIQKLVPDASNLARGHDVSVFHLDVPGAPAGGFRLAPLICYEDIIPAFVRRFDDMDPNLLVNITNDAWFGDTAEPWEHLQLAVYRAVEQRRDLVRAVNTGVTAFVDSTGRLYANTQAVDPGINPNAPPATLLDTVAMQTGRTVYMAVGDLFGELDLVALIAIFIFAERRARLARRASGEAPKLGQVKAKGQAKGQANDG